MGMNLCLKKDFCMWMMTVVFLLFFTWSMVTISTLPSLPLEGHRSYQHSLCATTGNGTGLHSSDQAEEPREDRPAKFGEHGQKIASDLAERRASRHAVRQAVEESDASKDTATPAKTEASGRSLAGRQKDLPQHVAAVARHEQDTTRTHTAFISNQLPPPQQDLQGVIKPAMTLSAEKSPKRWGPWKVECASDSQGADVLAGHSEATGGKRQHPSTQGGDLTQLGLKKEAAWYDMATEDSFLDRGNQGVRSRAEHLWWFSEDDIQKMELLSDAKVVSKARVPAHGQVLQVGLDGVGAAVPSGDHADRCEQGLCALIKRPDDWFEVFAFHLDRVLGLNRSLPIVSRKFHSDLLPYRYTSGTARPVVWWDPGIQHLPDDDNDQNSFSLTWLRYQAMLKAKCDSKGASRNPPVCIGIHHSEWGRLALFDFLLQVNDRLDRYCCGFEPDLSEPCVDNLLHAKCGTPNNMVLVHILVRKDDPSKLVFIDNAGRPFQPHANLNFLLVEGIDEFPERAVSVLRSGCLETMLLRSLYVDRDFWESRGGLAGLRPLVRTVQQRGRMLLQHVKDWKLRLNRDL